MIYFAYGSNLDAQDFRTTCSNAIALEPARLEDHQLCFPRWSQKRHCAVASVKHAVGATVWGALYRLTPYCLAALDQREGYDGGAPIDENRYIREVKSVKTLGNLEVKCFTYVARPEPDPGLPSAHYVSLMLNGARAHRFPKDYVDMLQKAHMEPIS